MNDEPSIETNELPNDIEAVLSRNEDGTLTLSIANSMQADVLDLSIKVTPPNKFVNMSKGGASWKSSPQYFSFNRVSQSRNLSTYLLENKSIASRFKKNSIVHLASEDGFFASSMDWNVAPPPGFLARNRFRLFFLFLIMVALIGLGKYYFPQVADQVCNRWSICLADQIALRDVKSCLTTAKVCEQAACIAPFKTKFSSSRLLPDVEKIEADSELQCLADEDRRYSEISRCVQEKINPAPCDIGACFAGFDMSQNAIKAKQAEAILAVAGERCRLASRPPVPGSPTAPAPGTATAPPNETTPPVASSSQSLSNGRHEAVQRYTGLRSRTDALNCPPTANFVVEVENGTFRYTRPDYFDGAPITRTWVGTIDQATGQIAILGNKGNPPTKNAMTIAGPFGSASVLSDFCGSGTFEISR